MSVGVELLLSTQGPLGDVDDGRNAMVEVVALLD